MLKNIRLRTGLFIFLLIFPISLSLKAQQEKDFIKGKVLEENEHPVVGANIYWLNTNIGTITDANGKFKLTRIKDNNTLVVSFVGFQNDTLNAENKDFLLVVLDESVNLDEVKIVYRQKSTEISLLDPMKIEKIGEKELMKAACCNLSESFETNPSVDVSFTDAVTGTRQIQMLGLAGPYTQITRENIPDVRGL
jgi:hypothetical protein